MTPQELIDLRESLGMTQADMALYLGLRHRSQVTQLEKGTTQIRGAKLELLVLLRDTGGESFSRKIQKNTK
jgi:transcriptional regulator with XRE-family HTH domain